MISGVLNPEKIWHQQLVHLPTSPVYWATLPWHTKKSFFNSIIHILQIIYVISEENKLILRCPPHLKSVAPLPCKNCTNFSFFSFFTRIDYRVPIRYTDKLRKRLVVIWAEFQQSVVDDAVDHWQKKTRSMYPCRRWSLWTFAVMLLTWHSICHTSHHKFTTGSFHRHRYQPTTGFFQSHQRLEECTYLQSYEKFVNFTR